jgi:hypothetical protein
MITGLLHLGHGVTTPETPMATAATHTPAGACQHMAQARDLDMRMVPRAMVQTIIAQVDSPSGPEEPLTGVVAQRVLAYQVLPEPW